MSHNQPVLVIVNRYQWLSTITDHMWIISRATPLFTFHSMMCCSHPSTAIISASRFQSSATFFQGGTTSHNQTLSFNFILSLESSIMLPKICLKLIDAKDVASLWPPRRSSVHILQANALAAEAREELEDVSDMGVILVVSESQHIFTGVYVCTCYYMILHANYIMCIHIFTDMYLFATVVYQRISINPHYLSVYGHFFSQDKAAAATSLVTIMARKNHLTLLSAIVISDISAKPRLHGFWSNHLIVNRM